MQRHYSFRHGNSTLRLRPPDVLYVESIPADMSLRKATFVLDDMHTAEVMCGEELLLPGACRYGKVCCCPRGVLVGTLTMRVVCRRNGAAFKLNSCQDAEGERRDATYIL